MVLCITIFVSMKWACVAGTCSYAWLASVQSASHVWKCPATVWADVLDSTTMLPVDFLQFGSKLETMLDILCNLRQGLLIRASIDSPKSMWRHTSTTVVGHGKYLAFQLLHRSTALQMQRATSGTTSETRTFQTAKSISCLLGWENATGSTWSCNRFDRQIWKSSINIISLASGQIMNFEDFSTFDKTMLASLASNSWTLNLP